MKSQLPPRIIMIDDEPKLTQLLKLIVEESMPCNVTTFNDPVAAYQRLLTETFNVISLDHRMPKMTGMAILELLRAHPNPNRHTPVLIFTGFRDEAESTQKTPLSDVLFLEKPIDDERYLRNLKIALQMNRKQGSSAA